MLPLIILFIYLHAVHGLAIDTKLELPDPTTGLISGKEFPVLDSSLSPKIIKAFYEINFVPVSGKPENSEAGYAAIPTNGKNCPYSRQLCKYLYFVPSKVSTVQEIEDLIRESKESGDVPVVKGTNNFVNIDEVMKEVNRTISDQVNKKVPTTSEVPVYKGVVKTEEVLKKAEKADHHPGYPISGYQPSRPFYLPHSRPLFPPPAPWSPPRPPSCLHQPCPWGNPSVPSLKF